ncbi:Fic family protein [Persicobacter psychrovividus]|uniref:Fic family protein n=1 Tax=Persicobacter psychrovividus TaxID=387638 RepID=UPI0030CA30A9
MYWSLIKNHCFQDGNKRVALASVISFWFGNDVDPDRISDFVRDQGASLTENIAGGKVEREELHQIIAKVLDEPSAMQ